MRLQWDGREDGKRSFYSTKTYHPEYPSKPRSSIIYLGFELILAHKLVLLCVFSGLSLAAAADKDGLGK